MAAFKYSYFAKMRILYFYGWLVRLVSINFRIANFLVYSHLNKPFLSLQNSSGRSLHSSRTESQSSIGSRNSQFSLQNVTWEASKTNLYGITEL